MTRVLWIATGGGLGALARYALMGLWAGQPIPYNIALINVAGSFFIAVVMTLAIEYGWLSERSRLFLSVGVLGGFTTFSTFMLGVETLLARHAIMTAYTYAVGSLLLGLAACWLGVAATRRVVPWLSRADDEPSDPSSPSPS